MKITKFGHCCLLIEINGKRILTDPGVFSDKQNKVKDIDIILITHEHQDHLHTESLQKVIEHNPKAKIVTNNGVGKIIGPLGIAFEAVEDGEKTEIEGTLIEGFGKVHAIIYKIVPPVENTGYFIDNTFFYPGDAFYNPGKHVEILALPVSAPWLKFSEFIDYAVELKPAKCFPVHDAILSGLGINFTHMQTEQILKGEGVSFISLKEGETKEF